MKRFLQYRVLPVIMAFSISLSIAVMPVRAVDPASIALVVSEVAKWWGIAKTSGEILQTLANWINGTGSDDRGDVWMSQAYMGNASNRYVVSKDNLSDICFDLEHEYDISKDDFWPVVETITVADGTFYVISVRSVHGYTIKPRNKAFLSFNGQILCAPYNETGDDDAHQNGKWVKYRTQPKQQIVSLEFLTRAAEYQRIQGFDCKIEVVEAGYILTYTTGSPPYHEKYVYGSPSGLMYVAPADNRVVNGDRDHLGGNVEIDQETGNITINGDENINVGIDIDGGTINLPDGVELDIIQTIYDEATKSYHVDAIDQSTNITFNYSYTYFIDYTSITYIGQTEEYNKYYEVYYELPDGRSSADLTAEDLEQLNVSMDILPYIRSADDVSIRALYHFDGDTRDSSYWNYTGGLTWNTGASITYMDAGVFNGALYLNENAHKFTITLPSNITMSDFTLQFRYYQSHTAAPQTDSSISIGGSTLMQFDGASIKDGSGTALISADIGNWQELCIMRSGGTVTYFHNGVRIGSVGNSSALTDKIVFDFGASQQTYKYFDELRFTQRAIYPTSGYEVSSVPFDTNLALVLPDSKTPVADAYWNFSSSKINLLASSGMHDWSNGDVTHLANIYNFMESNYMLDYTGSYWFGGNGYADVLRDHSHFPAWSKWDTFSDVEVFENYGLITNPSSVLSDDGRYMMNHLQTLFSNSYSAPSSSSYYLPTGGIMSILAYKPYGGNSQYYVPDGSYTFSMVDTEGKVGSVTFKIPVMTNMNSGNSFRDFTIEFNGYRIGMITTYPFVNTNQHSVAVWLVVQPLEVGKRNPFLYLELVEGSGTDLNAEYVEDVVVMDKDALNTPSLAIKTDLDITGHQIGGMRPSLPYKGLVWGLVEGGVIKSLQIYNGSAWEAVDGRIWTGERWVPYSAYNVLLMKDLYDVNGIVSPDDYEYIYTQEGFWSWLQKWLNDFKTALFGRLDQIIDGSGSEDTGEDSVENCSHAYAIDLQSDPTCTDPGKTVYSCPLCGDTYTEYVDALDHDWVEQTHVDDSYHLPAGVTCPGCSGTNFLPTLIDKEYSCTCNDCQTVWQEEARVDVGYTIYECSRCGEQRKDHNDSDSNLFEALGNFLADGVEWISDKLQQLVNSLSGISDIFTNMAETIKQYAGDFSGLFGEFLALMPADLMNVVWFGLVITIALVVWKKWFS